MKLLERLFDQVLVFQPEERKDCRGTMHIFHSEPELKQYAKDFTVEEQRVYSMPNVGTFFGIHFQPSQAKLISVIRGRGLDYVVDLRKDSPSYCAWKSVELSGRTPKVIYIPEGFGHAFLTLEDDTLQLFGVNAPFENGIGRVIHYQDPTIGLQFPMEPLILSEYDRTAPYLPSFTTK